jgi:hypothetical protein
MANAEKLSVPVDARKMTGEWPLVAANLRGGVGSGT